METAFKTPVRQHLNTVAAERELLAEAEMSFALGNIPDAAARAKLVCERYRYRARRRWNHDANIAEARADIVRIAEGVLS